MLIYDNEIIGKGSSVGEFGDGMFILFGDTAPDSLKDFCYTIEPKKVDGDIEPGQKLVIDDEKFEIKAVGDIAKRNLESLGHITVDFSGNAGAVLPGAIVVEAKSCPKLDLGTKIQIEK